MLMGTGQKLRQFGGIAFLLLTVAAVGFSTKPALAQGNCGCMDLAFVIDDTGSMGDAIDNVKAGLTAIIGEAQAASGGDLHMALVTFKNNPNVRVGFTDDASQVETAIMALSAGGGGGEPEASDEALRLVATGSSNCSVDGGPLGEFRPQCLKIAILVTDARPAGCDDNFTPGVDDVNAAQVATLAAAAGIRISAVQVLNGFEEATKRTIMTNYATTTGGAYAEVPSNGSGLADVIMAIIEGCGAGLAAKAPAPALSASVLGALLLMLAAWGWYRLRRPRATMRL